MRSYYSSSLLAELDRINEARDEWRRRSSFYHRSLLKIYRFLVPTGQSVLELGCSRGDLLAGLEPARGVGVDLSRTAVTTAQRKYGGHAELEFIQDNAETVTLDEQFDTVILADVVGYLFDVQHAFENARGMMAPHSRMIVSSYNFVWEPVFRVATWLGLKQRTPAQNWLSNADVANLLELAGFEVIRTEGFMLLPVYVPVLSALLNGLVAKVPLIRHLTVAQFVIARPAYRPTEAEAQSRTVSVVVPARNEAGNIEAAVTRTPPMGQWTEFIFVEGGSTDDTWAEIQKLPAKFPERRIKIMQQDGKGKKDAVYKGFAHAEGEILMILDADLTMPPEDLSKYYRAIAENTGEFINGVRLVYPMEDKAMRFLNLIANKCFSLAFSYILGQPYKDTLCGTKVLWRRDYDRIVANRQYFGDFDPYGDFDLIFGAAKLQLKAVQMPIRYRERTYGETQISRFSGGWLLLRMTVIGFLKFKWYLR